MEVVVVTTAPTARMQVAPVKAAAAREVVMTAAAMAAAWAVAAATVGMVGMVLASAVVRESSAACTD